jgi:hypothetical protein
MARQRPTKSTPDARSRKPTGTGTLVTVRQVTQGCVIKTDNTVLAWVEVDGVGFDLLPPQEQDTILLAWQAVLHTLTFPMQIVLMPEPIDLQAEVTRLAAPVGDPILDAIGRDFAALVQQHARHLERVTYLLVIPAPSIDLARERGQTVINALATVHPDLRPGFVDTDRILGLLATAFGVPLPGPARVYFPAVDRLWGAEPPATKGETA